MWPLLYLPFSRERNSMCTQSADCTAIRLHAMAPWNKYIYISTELHVHRKRECINMRLSCKVKVCSVSIVRVSFRSCIFSAHSLFRGWQASAQDKLTRCPHSYFRAISTLHPTWLAYVFGMWEETREGLRKHRENEEQLHPEKTKGANLDPSCRLKASQRTL